MGLKRLEHQELQRTDELPSVGVEEIDRQHRVLMQRWWALEDARIRGDHRAVRANLWFLERYAAEHFVSEERTMEEARYPEHLRHRHEHERFAERIRRLRLDVDSGREAGEAAHFHWIASWFLNHVREADAQLARFLGGR
jgi:hemerythrin